MTGVLWREYMPLIQLSTAKCPVAVIVAKVREAAREFCRLTQMWEVRTVRADLLRGEAVYAVRAPEQTDIAAIARVLVDGSSLLGVTLEQWRTLPHDSTHRPQYFEVTEPGLVHVSPVPSVDMPGVLELHAVLQPSVASERGPDFLYSRYGDSIAAGAAARLMNIPDRPWTDPKAAAFYRRRFEDEAMAARIMTTQAGSTAPATVRPVAFC